MSCHQGPVLCASSFPSHTSPDWEHRRPSSLAIFPVCPLQGQLGSPLHFLMTWFCSCQWHWLDFDLKFLFVPTLTSDISLLNPSTDVIPNEHLVAADTTLDSCLSVCPLYQHPKHQPCKKDDLLMASISLFSWGLLDCFPSNFYWITLSNTTFYLQSVHPFTYKAIQRPGSSQGNSTISHLRISSCACQAPWNDLWPHFVLQRKMSIPMLSAVFFPRSIMNFSCSS